MQDVTTPNKYNLIFMVGLIFFFETVFIFFFRFVAILYVPTNVSITVERVNRYIKSLINMGNNEFSTLECVPPSSLQ